MYTIVHDKSVKIDKQTNIHHVCSYSIVDITNQTILDVAFIKRISNKKYVNIS
jgi:hypothetical protein